MTYDMIALLLLCSNKIVMWFVQGRVVECEDYHKLNGTLIFEVEL